MMHTCSANFYGYGVLQAIPGFLQRHIKSRQLFQQVRKLYSDCDCILNNVTLKKNACLKCK